jgi:hypothetical protein
VEDGVEVRVSFWRHDTFERGLMTKTIFSGSLERAMSLVWVLCGSFLIMATPAKGTFFTKKKQRHEGASLVMHANCKAGIHLIKWGHASSLK